MAKDKKSVLLYCDIIHTVEKMDDKTAGEFFKHYLRYINDLNPKTDNLVVDIAFESVKQNLKRDLKKWEDTLETKSLSGQEGNLKRWHKDIYNDYKKGKHTLEESLIIAKGRTAIKPIANIAVNVTDTVTVKDINNNIVVKSIDFDGLLNFINKTLSRKFRIINKEVKAKYKARIKEGYKKEDIIQAITNASKNSFHKENNYQYLTPDFFSRASTLDKFSDTVNNNISKTDKLVEYAKQQNKLYGNS